jgi:hypothetical protein
VAPLACRCRVGTAALLFSAAMPACALQTGRPIMPDNYFHSLTYYLLTNILIWLYLTIIVLWQLLLRVFKKCVPSDKKTWPDRHSR